MNIKVQKVKLKLLKQLRRFILQTFNYLEMNENISVAVSKGLVFNPAPSLNAIYVTSRRAAAAIDSQQQPAVAGSSQQ